MRNFIIEYTCNGWPEYEIQRGIPEAMFDKSKEVLSIWEFDTEEDCQKTLRELRAYRLSLIKEKPNDK